jgi:GntR family transcriptional regulator/MocR family aminotransferase
MTFHVSLVGRRDLSGEIYRQMRRAILDGRLRPGDALPPSRELARTLSVSRMTVTVAYDRLAGEGFVASRVGSGTFVGEHAARVQGLAARGHGVLQPRALWAEVPLPTLLVPPPPFDFRTGVPDAALFPHRAWRRRVARALRAEEVDAGRYADPAGHLGLREAIARHIGVSRGVEASPDDVTVTGGTQQALHLIARVLLEPGDRVAVEDPGYAPARRVFETLGLRVAGVPVDGDGLVVDALPRRVRLVYVTPSHQYPLGVTLSLARRQALLAWAARHQAAVVEDDYDSEFRFGGRPLEPLQTLDAAGRVVYVGSFSKTMLPTLRLGFLVTPPSLRAAVHRARYVTDWHSPTLAQAALAAFLSEGAFARHVRRVSGAYRVRHQTLADGLARELGDHLEVVPSTTGLHLAALARGAAADRVAAIARRAADRGVVFHPLSRFAVGEHGRAGIVLGYGAIPTARIDEGLRRLRECFDRREARFTRA